MRAVFSLIGLVIVVAIIAMMMKKQLQSVAPAVVAPASTGAGNPPPTLPEQSRALQQKVQQDVNRALQQGAASRAAD